MARKRIEVPALSTELSDADLGDVRLNRRLGLLADRPAALHDIPNKRVRNCGMVDITEESKPRLLALSPRSAILPR